jgi:predicted RNA-binding Zn ribbon-like protein
MAATSVAPGRLELVRAFVNSRDVDQDADELSRAAGLASWLVGHDLLPVREMEGVTEDDRVRAVAAREAFRELLLSNNDGRPADPASLATLNEVAQRAGISLHLEADGARLEPLAEGIDGALGRLLLIAHEAMEHGEWHRLKACRNDTCQWGFYDHSKNRSRTWCSMDSCGSKLKSRAYRARRRAADRPGPESDPSPFTS